MADAESRLFVSPIASPLASDKMCKKLIKLVKKGMKDKLIHRGVKETVKAVKKGRSQSDNGCIMIGSDSKQQREIFTNHASLPHLDIQSNLKQSSRVQSLREDQKFADQLPRSVP